MKLEVTEEILKSLLTVIALIVCVFAFIVMLRETMRSEDIITMHKLSLEQSYNMQSKGKK